MNDDEDMIESEKPITPIPTTPKGEAVVCRKERGGKGFPVSKVFPTFFVFPFSFSFFFFSKRKSKWMKLLLWRNCTQLPAGKNIIIFEGKNNQKRRNFMGWCSRWVKQRRKKNFKELYHLLNKKSHSIISIGSKR